MLFQVASENPKKTCKVLRTVSGKRPLQDATDVLNRLPLQPVDEPAAEDEDQNDVEPSPESQMNIQEPDHGDIYAESLPSTSPPHSPSYLSDLFEADFPVDSESLRGKLNRVLDNQKVLFSLISKLMGEVSQLSRSPGVGVQGWDLGNVTATPNLSMDSALNWSLGDRQDTEHYLFGDGAGDNIQAMPQNSDGEGEDSFFREVIKIKGESCSVGNFATRLVRKLFSFEELVNRNCRGSKGKEALDSSKLATVKEYCFKMYPTPPGLREQQWGKCVIAIDEYLRRKKKEISNRQD